MDAINATAFEQIGQTSVDLNIDLEAESITNEIYDVRAEQGFEYPAMLITGIKFQDTLRVLKSVRQESYRLFDVWLDLEDGNPPVKQGTLPANSDTFLIMRYLGLRVTLYLDENNIQSLDLQDPSVLESFI